MEHAWENAFLASEALRDEIIREAETLYKSYGLTPSQLQARVAELEAALAAESARLDWLNESRDRFYNLDRVTSIVGKGFASTSATSWHQDVRGAIDEARR